MRRGAEIVKVNPVEQVAVADPGHGEEHLLAAAQVVRPQHPHRVSARRPARRRLLRRSHPELALNFPAHAPNRGGGDDPLRSPADPEERVDARLRVAHRDRRLHVAVGDELDSRARHPKLLDEPHVPVAVQHDAGDLADGFLQRTSDGVDVDGRRSRDVHVSHRGGPDDELVHVERGPRVEQRAALGDGDDGDGAVATAGDEGGAVDGVDGDLRDGLDAGADELAVVEHGRVVLLALADDDAAGEVDVHERLAHGSHRGAVGGYLVALAEPSRGGDRGGLGDADHLEGEVAVAARERARGGLGGDLVDDVVGHEVLMVPGELVVRRGIRVSRQRMGGRVRLVRVERGEFLAVFDVVVLEDDVLGDGPARVGDRDDLGVRAAGAAAAERAPGGGRIGPAEGLEPLGDDAGGGRDAAKARGAMVRASKGIDGGAIRSQGGGRRAHFVGYTARARRRVRVVAPSDLEKNRVTARKSVVHASIS